MKKRCTISLLLFSGGIAFGQQYSIDWFTIDGGGGTSTNGQYSLTATIGQPDVGHLSGGNFSVDGGFWGIVAAVQAPGAPLLRVFSTTTNTIVVAWPAPSTGFLLQQSSDLTPNGWASAPAAGVVGNENQVIVATPTGHHFYRLKK